MASIDANTLATQGLYPAGYAPVPVGTQQSAPAPDYQQVLDQLRLSSQAGYAPAAVAPPAPAGSLLGDLLHRLADLVHRLFSPAPPPASAGRRTSLVISSFNILGSAHTAPGGDAKGYASGVTRIRWAADLLRQKDVDVVGFQELYPDQAREFQRVAGDTYGMYPGDTRVPMGSRNSIAWRKDEWDLVKGQLVKMPSHRGNMWPVPVVRLRNKQTGQEAYFLNFHNAPGYHTGTQQAQRDKAAAMEVDLVNRLKRESGLPVIVTGDMNDKLRYYDAMIRGADMKAANARPDGRPPAQPGIDWIFGSQQVAFAGFERERGALERKVSDHAMIVSRAKLS